MPCYYPIKGHQSPEGGKLRFDQPIAGNITKIIPCGRCVGCKIERSRQWAVRSMHELKSHTCASFITLTYADENIPHGNTLVKEDWVLFMKRLRQAIAPQKIRFLMCGEYGERMGRPHYHALIFGYDFPDKLHYKNSPKSGCPLYRSAELEKLWPYGFSDIGEVNFDTAQYVAGYCTKKITGELASEHYKWIDTDTGEVFDRLPEFSLMSRKPGLGKEWIEKWHQDVYPSDKVTLNNKQSKPPRYYDKWLEEADPALFEAIKADREEKALQHEHEHSDAKERMQDQEMILHKRRKDREREYD